MINRFRLAGLAVLALCWCGAAAAQWNTPNPVINVTRQKDGVDIWQKDGILRLRVKAADVLHVTYDPLNQTTEKRAADKSLVDAAWPGALFDLSTEGPSITLATESVKAVVNRETGALQFFGPDASGLTGRVATGPGETAEAPKGRLLTTESYRTLKPVEVNGEKTYHAESFFAIYGSHEGLYGLGQHQAGVWNYRGETVELSQENTNITIPLLVSTNGYGIYWNNPSASRVNNRFIHMLYFSSEVADRIDYYFIYGPEPDQIVARYRQMTGDAPMFGRWAYGFWQCKNKYQSQKDLETVAAKYRELHIPVDNIVQDWFWWVTMGEMKWNANYPDPQGLIDTLHKEHFHLMVSIWPYFRPGSATYDEFDKNGWFIAKMQAPNFHPLHQALYDPTNPEAAKKYWANANAALFQKGVDAWWLDTDEPETEGREANILTDHQLHIGSGARYLNSYPDFHTAAVADGQRAASDQKRVFILSRSAYAGAQRNGITAWSGDVLSDWLSYQRQIPAGLNYAMSGMPYWTTDVGGFISGGNLADPNFRELFIRWFQFGAFSPIFRVHGTRIPDENELWSYGPDAQKILVNFDTLRYRLLPYIYSQAWQVTSHRGTIMRPLVMDWRNDVEAQNTSDEYLFGPAILVSPVTQKGAVSRAVYLPKAQWVDFWTGERQSGEQRIQAAAPLDKLPLFVRAGSIIPMGPKMEWATEKATDPIELRIYPGADGDFVLYEDENDNYNYEKGAHATIALHWNDAAHTLTVGKREGSYKGMLDEHVFRVVLVGKDHGVGVEETNNADATLRYKGEKLEQKF